MLLERQYNIYLKGFGWNLIQKHLIQLTQDIRKKTNYLQCVSLEVSQLQRQL